MMKLYDGREELYQWDLNRKLIISDLTVDEIHFCNKTSDCSLVVEVYEEEGLHLANIPNILLQTDWPIHAYAYCGDCYTKECITLKINKRTKPADYVYTETEILGVEEIAYRAANKALNDSKDEFINEITETMLSDIDEVLVAIIEHQNQLLGVSE